MTVVLAVSRNLLDTSQIQEKLSGRNDIEFKKVTRLAQLADKIDEHSGSMTAFIDYSLFDHPDDLIELYTITDDDNISIVVYGPHELMAELSNHYPSMILVARSQFFRDPSRFIHL